MQRAFVDPFGRDLYYVEQSTTIAPVLALAPNVIIHKAQIYRVLANISTTHMQPTITSPTVQCCVLAGTGLIVIAMSLDQQWLQLHGSNTWIQCQWVTPSFL